jgi:hypothetical protein
VDRFHAVVVTESTLMAALLRPTSVTIHDDGDVFDIVFVIHFL